jgi:hypothetical protein
MTLTQVDVVPCLPSLPNGVDLLVAVSDDNDRASGRTTGDFAESLGMPA